MTQRPPACERTRRLVDRVVEDKVTPEDRTHAATCTSCGPVLARASRFDDELRRSARGLISERLPNGVLDPDLAPRLAIPPMRQAAPGVAGIFAAVVVLVLATSVALAPGGLGGTQPPPTGLGMTVPAFRATVDIIRDVRALEYSCITGHALPTTGPSARLGEREGVRCLTPKTLESASAAIIPVENGDGEVVEILIEGELYGTDTVVSRNELATTMGKLTFLALSDPAIAADAGAFIEETLPRLRVLSSGDEALMLFGDVRVFLQRHIAGDYVLFLQLD